MKNSLNLIFYVVIIAATLKTVNAQEKTNSNYLIKIGQTDSLGSKVLNEQRHFWVQLPENYNPKNSKKYPVAYVLDGSIHLKTVQIVQSYYSGGYIPEMILVGIANNKNRTLDLTPTKIESDKHSGGADNFTKFIQNELIPYIDKKYKTTSYRTLIGHSYGGLFTVNTFINYPQLFNNYLAIDPSLDWDNQKMLALAKRKLNNENYKGKSLFISLNGQLHMQNNAITIDNVMEDSSPFTQFHRANISFSNFIKENHKGSFYFDWKFYPNDIHGTISFPSIVDGLISMFKWFQMENTDKINSFETPTNEILNIIKYRAEKLQKHFGYFVPPYPEELLNISGYMNLDIKQLDKSKMYFELGIEYYPNSPNVYDSMADFYEQTNNIPKAIHFVTKAYEISGQKAYKQRLENLKSKN